MKNVQSTNLEKTGLKLKFFEVVMVTQVIAAFYKAFGQTFIKENKQTIKWII